MLNAPEVRPGSTQSRRESRMSFAINRVTERKPAAPEALAHERARLAGDRVWRCHPQGESQSSGNPPRGPQAPCACRRLRRIRVSPSGQPVPSIRPCRGRRVARRNAAANVWETGYCRPQIGTSMLRARHSAPRTLNDRRSERSCTDGDAGKRKQPLHDARISRSAIRRTTSTGPPSWWEMRPLGVLFPDSRPNIRQRGRTRTSARTSALPARRRGRAQIWCFGPLTRGESP